MTLARNGMERQTRVLVLCVMWCTLLWWWWYSGVQWVKLLQEYQLYIVNHHTLLIRHHHHLHLYNHYFIVLILNNDYVPYSFSHLHSPFQWLFIQAQTNTHTHHCTQTQSIQQRVSWALSIFLCRMNESGWMNWMGRRRLSGCMCLCDARSRIELKETELLEKRNRKNLIIHKNQGLCHESGLYPLSKSTHTLIYVSFLFFSIPLGRSLGAMGCEGNIKIIFLMFTKIPNEKWKIIKNIIISCF